MKKFFLLFLLAFVLFACDRFGNKESGGAKDMRIVCLSKQLTEMVFALGKGHDIVAVDLSSTYPDSAKLLKTVGYHRSLSPEAIVAMNPGLVIHSNDIGPDNVLPQIEKAGLKTKAFGGANTVDSARLLLKELGNFFGEEPKADSLVKKMDEGLARAADTLKARKIHDSLKVMIIHFGLRNNNYFVMSGRNGVGDKMIRLAGGTPTEGVREMSPEAVALANPDVIIATDYGYDKMGSMDKFISSVPGVALTNAGKNRRVIRFEEHDLIYFGPRSGDNVIKLIQELYPITGAATK
ncbi:heme/hemin ABC transporter substrate-binding protein [Flavisolibacter ginsenosidimutans]|uniref:ABC transporter substrate-binding protein n=1 Tax=Flavisolibacter ginsenosidimutans TaxID=661481 RepID=A0A5B8UG15_9BACT|nr:ABC transporter substrate-binding protein [Flavisolibacter ginsenosidimutans]QEC55040.1 ABC transporter substrate-binding protein [Flavisolibacter ginsenosidimutans]